MAIRQLHIGGKTRSDGWEVFDAPPNPWVDHVGDAVDLGCFPDDTFRTIYASHVIEHFDYKDRLGQALREWFRVLAPGGMLYVSAPDMDVLCRLFLARDQLTPKERFDVVRIMFGGHTDPWDYHLVGLNAEFLAGYLYGAGFVSVKKVREFGLFQDSSSGQFKGTAISVNLIAEKPLLR